MTALALAVADGLLLMACATLTVLLIGRHRGAVREEARLEQIAEDYRAEVDRLSAYNGRLLADNANLTDRLDAVNADPALVNDWTEFVAHVNPEDFA